MRAYGTPDSHVVPHRSTDEACSGLTAQFGRDTVRFTEYGRRHSHHSNANTYTAGSHGDCWPQGLLPSVATAPSTSHTRTRCLRTVARACHPHRRRVV